MRWKINEIAEWSSQFRADDEVTKKNLMSLKLLEKHNEGPRNLMKEVCLRLGLFNDIKCSKC